MEAEKLVMTRKPFLEELSDLRNQIYKAHSLYCLGEKGRGKPTGTNTGQGQELKPYKHSLDIVLNLSTQAGGSPTNCSKGQPNLLLYIS